MKITILSTAYPLRGGIAHFNGLLYKELSKNNEVTVTTFKRQYPNFLFPGKTQLEENESSEKISSSVEVDSINPFNWIKTGLKIKRSKPNLLIFKYWMPFFAPCFGTISRIVKTNRFTKILVICDNVIPHERKPGDIVLAKYFFSAADYFVVMSEKVKTDLQKIKKDAKHLFLPHPLYSNFGLPVKKENAKKTLAVTGSKIILFFGFIREYKGLDVLLKAIALLKNEIDVKLIVAGEFYTDKQKYLTLIDKLGLNNYVILRNDFIPTEQVKYYFSASDLLILPYKDATQSGIAQIAINFNVPIIAADVGGLSEVVKDGEIGFIVEKENPAQLAEAVKRFYTKNMAEKFSLNLEKEKQYYSWENFVSRLINFINEQQD